jgi:hypothetical protein
MEILCGLQKNYLLRIGSTQLITILKSLSQKLLHILEFPSFKSIVAVTHG